MRKLFVFYKRGQKRKGDDSMITKPRNKSAFVVKTSLFDKFYNEAITKKDVHKIYDDASKFERNIEKLKKK